MTQIFRLAVPLLAVTLLAGCTFTHTVDPAVQQAKTWPSITKIPVHAGVYYSPQFSNQEFSRKIGSHIYTVPIGANSVRLFDEILHRTFEKTSRIAGYSGDKLNAGNVDVILAPSLEHFDFQTGLDSDSERYSISYRTTLYSKQGVPIASWVVSGKENSHPTIRTIGSMIEDDMQDAAVKFLNGIESNVGPAIATLASNTKKQNAPLDTRGVFLAARTTELPWLDQEQNITLKAEGVVILEVVTQGEPLQGVIVRSSDMRLRLMDGRVIEPLSISSVLGSLDKTSQKGGVISALISGPLGLLATVSEEHEKQASRESQFRTANSSLFGERKLGKVNKETGFVFFRLPKEMKSVEGATLTAWMVDPTSAQGTKLATAISANQ